MPHIIIECSEDSLGSVDQPGLVNTAFGAVLATGLFTPENIKVRLHPVEFYQLGLADCGFMHVMCRVHSGKTVEQKKQLSESLSEALANLLTTSAVITVEVVEMDSLSYAKKVK